MAEPEVTDIGTRLAAAATRQRIDYDHAIDRLSVWAVRYALGRQTYAVPDVIEALMGHRDALTPGSRGAICRDIDKALASGNAGSAMDSLEWGRLRDALEPRP